MQAGGVALIAVSPAHFDSEQSVRGLFETACIQSPAMIFIDEIDSLPLRNPVCDAERRVMAEFLQQMDNVKTDKILVLAATSAPWSLNSSVLRCFDHKIYVPLPDFDARLALLKLKVKEIPFVISEEEFQELARLTEGFSSADIGILCRVAAMAPLNRMQQAEFFVEYQGQLLPCNPDQPYSFKARLLDLTPDQLRRVMQIEIRLEDFRVALQTTKRTVTLSDLAKFEQWREDFGKDE
jgi:vacuolar protein-sorting-associated protein 4